jgi:hypothetical protein
MAEGTGGRSTARPRCQDQASRKRTKLDVSPTHGLVGQGRRSTVLSLVRRRSEMALMTRTTLVRCGMSVLRDGTADATRLGLGYQGGNQAPAASSVRHLSPHAPRTEPEPRRPVVDRLNHDVGAVKRAGRPGCWAGVPHSRMLVLAASRSPVSRVLRQRGASLMAAGRAGSEIAAAAAAVDQARSGRLRTGSATTLRPAGAPGWRIGSQGGKCRTGLPEFTRAGEASMRSTRGKGAK